MPKPTRPHVLLVTTDHWPGSLLGVAGHPTIQTPTLDQIARNGARFTRAYSECPVCIPARRTLLTGTTPRTHGDRTFQVELPMPGVPTVAQSFRDQGYQAYAVGKLHVYPPRDRAGFDDVILNEEGRPQYGWIDDYELFLGDRGFVGEQFTHGMSNNDYVTRPWHLPEDCHVTNWTTREMCRMIQRRDPTRPGFWYLSYSHPHPPLAPLACYLDMYRDVDLGRPLIGRWAEDVDALPYLLRRHLDRDEPMHAQAIAAAYRAFFALCTHIDHQLRLVIGTLREEGLLDNTILLFTADHGDMLGQHRQWAKRLYYEGSANIPMLLMGTKDCPRVGIRRTDDRLVGLQDVMPTLLDLAGLEIPDSVEGQSMVGDARRSTFYGEHGESDDATRMLHDGRFKLIYYPIGNRRQLFDLERDPHELEDLAGSSKHADVLERLTAALVREMHGSDARWITDGALTGEPDREIEPQANRGLLLQRGPHWPATPQG